MESNNSPPSPEYLVEVRNIHTANIRLGALLLVPTLILGIVFAVLSWRYGAPLLARSNGGVLSPASAVLLWLAILAVAVYPLATLIQAMTKSTVARDAAWRMANGGNVCGGRLAPTEEQR
jgi:hypothetical protein